MTKLIFLTIRKLLFLFCLQHHHYQQLQPPGTPAPSVFQQQPPVAQQPLLNQFNRQSQPVLSTASQPVGVANGQQVQYVQLSNGLLVPLGSVSQPHLPSAVSPNMFYSQQHLPQAGGQVPMNLQCYQTTPQSPQQVMQQQLLQQQMQQQQQQLQQQQQQLIALGADPRSQFGGQQSQQELFNGQQMSPQQQQYQHQQQQQFQQQQQQQQQQLQQQQQQQPEQQVESFDGSPQTPSNTRRAQKQQIHHSKDAGFKCSQI
jgi:hypothetical protein